MMNLRLLNQQENTTSQNAASALAQSLRMPSFNNDSPSNFLDNMGESLDFNQGEQKDDEDEMGLEKPHDEVKSDELHAGEGVMGPSGTSWSDA